MTTLASTTHAQHTPSSMMKQVWFDSADTLPAGIAMRWIGDNLGLGDDNITVTVSCGLGKGYLNLEETLRRIDQFEEYGRTRILSALRLQFDMPEAAIYSRPWGGVQ